MRSARASFLVSPDVLAKGDTVTVGPKDEAKADDGAIVDNLLPTKCHAAAATTTRAASAASAGTSWPRWIRVALVDATVLPTSSEKTRIGKAMFLSWIRPRSLTAKWSRPLPCR